MVDCHIHMVLDGVFWRSAICRHQPAPDLEWIRKTLEKYRDSGYTYLRDGGDRWGVGEAARALAADYGIRYRTPLAPLCKEGHYGGFIGKTYKDLREYAALVKEAKAQGADFIKIMISGLMDFDRFGVLTEPGMDKKEIRELIRIAHSEGMAVMAHANGAKTVLWAAEAGVDSVEHGAYLDEEALQAMAQQGTVWVPTLSTIGNLRNSGRFSERDVQAILENALQNVSQYTGLIASGSDAGAWNVPHGSHTEQSLLQQAGVTQSRLEAGAQKIQKEF